MASITFKFAISGSSSSFSANYMPGNTRLASQNALRRALSPDDEEVYADDDDADDHARNSTHDARLNHQESWEETKV